LLRPRLQQAANLRIYQEYRSTIQSMGEDFSSLWDDITSGNIGNRILSNWKKMLFQMLAQWAMNSAAMRTVAGSMLGSLLFGPNNSTMQMLGGGAGVAMQGGGTAGIGSLFGLGGSTAGFGGSLIPGVFGMPTGTAATFPGGATTSSTMGASELAGAVDRTAWDRR
jgi:hypothetical protein